MERLLVLATAGAVLYAGAALADNIILSYAPGDPITLSGTVEKIESDQEFTLRDNSGSFDVTLLPGRIAVLDEGDSVSVTGAFGQHAGAIEAYTIEVHQRADI